MKAIYLALALFLAAPVALEARPPSLHAMRAAEIAQEDLESRGLETKIYIVEINLKTEGVIGREPAYWEVLWSEAFPAQTKGRHEIGLRIAMDGSYTRSVR